MAIQYPKLEHVTLPSVDGFNGSLNILRDPPKAIFTKRIDKVGQNNDINDLIDGSSDRMNEGILVYARGVNPMVSVSYNNNSNNAGSFTNNAFGQGNNINQGHHQGTRQAYLPYRIADKGAFRPPIRSLRDLLPLSRQPRAWFQALTNPGFIDYAKKKHIPTQFRMIRDTLKTEQTIKPNQSVKIEKPILENYKMQNVINDKHISIEAFSGNRTMDLSNFTRENIDQYKGIQENYEQVNAITNKNDHRSQNLDNINIDQKQYIQHKDYYETLSKPSLQTNQGIEGLSIDQNQYIGDKNYYETFSNPSLQTNQGIEGLSIDQNQYIQDKDYYDFVVNRGRDINVKTLDQLMGNNKESVKNILQFQTESGKQTGYTLLTDVPEMNLDYHMPQFAVDSSLNDPTVYKRVEHQNVIQLHENLPKINTVRNVLKIEDMNNFEYGTSRKITLPETLKKGEFRNAGAEPTLDRSEIQFRSDPHKDKIRKYLNENQFTRFQH